MVLARGIKSQIKTILPTVLGFDCIFYKMLTSEAGFNLWTFCFKFLWLMIYKSKISNCSKPVSEEKNSARIFLLLIFISSGIHVLPIFRLWLTLQKPWFHDASMLIRLRMYFHLLYLQSIQLSRFLHLPFHSHTGHKRSQFGRGQIITVGDWWNPSVTQGDRPSRVLWAGSDPRADGCAQGY